MVVKAFASTGFNFAFMSMLDQVQIHYLDSDLLANESVSKVLSQSRNSLKSVVSGTSVSRMLICNNNPLATIMININAVLKMLIFFTL